MSPTLIDFDPFSATFFDDPYDTYSRLRDEAPVYFNERYGFYALSRYADVVAAHGDPGRLVSSYGVTLELLLMKRPMKTNMMIVMDPPMHSRQRKLVSQAFSRRAIGGLEPLVADMIATFLDQLSGRSEFDIVGEFAAVFPVEVISQSSVFLKGSASRCVTGSIAPPSGGGKSEYDTRGYGGFSADGGILLESRQGEEGRADGLLISKLIEVILEDDLGNPQRLNDDDVAAFSVLIAGAGSETVTKLIGSGVVLFDEHPQQWALVRSDPAAIPPAVEEVLRMRPPSQYQGRFAVESVSFEGGTIPARSPVLLLTGAATRDPRIYDQPDEFDITRGGHTTLAFGYGVHGCLGAWLARLESRLAFEGIRERWPGRTVQRDGLERVNMSNVAGYSSVPVIVS